MNINNGKFEISHLSFCKKSQPIEECKKLIDIFPEGESASQNFCSVMGIKINPDEDTCYKGIPASFIDSLKVKRNQNARKVAKVPIDYSPLWLWSWAEGFRLLGKYMLS